jgi:tRNA G18 (ribose-2'-O)-methylase SpoU
MTRGQASGDRCPLCLGETLPVSEVTAFDETNTWQEMPAKAGQFCVLLDNIRSAWNVGSILRSVDGFGFSHAYLCGITPTPENAAVRKTALGAAEFVTWSAHKDAVKLARQLSSESWGLWALERTDRAVPIQAVEVGNSRTVLIVGNEITGVDPGLLEIADRVVFLPMSGAKRSFNVAVAFAVAAYAMRTRLG